MFGINNKKSNVVSNGVYNLQSEMVNKINRAASDMVVYDYNRSLQMESIARNLSSAVVRTVADINHYADLAGVDFCVETESVVRLSRM